MKLKRFADSPANTLKKWNVEPAWGEPIAYWIYANREGAVFFSTYRLPLGDASKERQCRTGLIYGSKRSEWAFHLKEMYQNFEK